MFACQAAGVVPDIITLSKALTAGTLPLAATIARGKIFDAFWSDDPAHALMHGPTYMANALACAAANASLDLFEREPRQEQVASISAQLWRGLEACTDLPGVEEVRVMGAVGVVEFSAPIAERERLRARFRGGRRVRPSVRQGRLSDAGFYDRRGRPRQAHRDDLPSAEPTALVIRIPPPSRADHRHPRARCARWRFRRP